MRQADGRDKGQAVRVVLGSILALGLAACASGGGSGPYDPANVRPHWYVKNAPVPVPHPKPRPTPPKIAPAAATVSTSAHYVRIRPGDTVYGIARRHGLDVKAVIAANGIEPPYLLKPGGRLKVPVTRYHVVAKGDTSYGISRRYDVDLSALAKVNHLRPPYSLSVGQRLKLPGSAVGDVTKTALAPPPARSGKGFAWPLRGPVLSSYGVKPAGLHNDGINIAAKAGDPVRAADDGVVAYIGDDLKSYGNLVLIKHADGWVTAYAHNQRILVTRGQRLRRGDKIAVVGATGAVTRPQLHFEMRHGRRAVNPMKFLPK